MADEAGILRSAAQSRVQLYIPYETAHDTVKALGEVGLFQPEDLSEDAEHSQGGRSNCREMLIDGLYTLLLYALFLQQTPTLHLSTRHLPRS